MKSILFLSVLILASLQGVNSDTAAITGNITVAGTNKPLSGVQIQIDHTTVASTGPDGRFAVGNIVPGRHEIAISYRGYLLAGRTGEDAGSVLRPPSNILGTVELNPGHI